ncbi:hypothetical protein [Nonomuraea sp. WAC 01424]|uniref:hypothetical protein n=1 Tax=Nonomuraea sp. WAC 01424 TaxID=2203200 RepID=UPI00163C1C99|nr:hypothetical protein [Nonomuraea sp. WAC 01424]
MNRKRRFGLYVLAAFAIFYLFTRPAQAAAAVNGAFNGVMQGADRLAVFFTNILA